MFDTPTQSLTSRRFSSPSTTLRYFVGLSIDEAAEALGVSRATANRHWAYAKAWLRCEIGRPDESAPE
jgi:DNA-directed RNA polymerase specialized sigma24 family protein